MPVCSASVLWNGEQFELQNELLVLSIYTLKKKPFIYSFMSFIYSFIHSFIYWSADWRSKGSLTSSSYLSIATGVQWHPVQSRDRLSSLLDGDPLWASSSFSKWADVVTLSGEWWGCALTRMWLSQFLSSEWEFPFLCPSHSGSSIDLTSSSASPWGTEEGRALPLPQPWGLGPLNLSLEEVPSVMLSGNCKVM